MSDRLKTLHLSVDRTKATQFIETTILNPSELWPDHRRGTPEDSKAARAPNKTLLVF